MQDLVTLSIRQARDLLRQGDLTAQDLTTACLERITQTEPQLGALLHQCTDAALDTARQLDAHRTAQAFDAQPLWGIPVTLKDCITLKGTPATAGSRILEGFIPPYDAFVASRLKEAGAIIVGKNNMDEFAMGSSTENSSYAPAHNPWNQETIPGGSSGGSAASVAACQCFASLGSDTGGSIRQPASLCGCVGLKPTYGRISRYGLLAYASSMDQIGPLTRSVEDAAFILQAIAGKDERDSTSAAVAVDDYVGAVEKATDLKGTRLGLPREFMETAALDPGVAEVCQKARETARQLGAEVVEVSLPHTKYALAVYYILASAEASSNLARYDGVRYGLRAPDVKDLDDLYTRSRTLGFGAEVQRRILLGTYVLSAGYYDAYYRKAAQVRRLIRQDYVDALGQCDALLAPISPLTAWPLGSVTRPLDMYQMDIFTLSLNLAGLPGLAIPVGFSNGLPVGMQLMGPAFSEARLLAAGRVLTLALGTEYQHAPL